MSIAWFILAVVAVFGLLNLSGAVSQIARAWNVYMASLLTEHKEEEKNDG